jgi:hypothetical protein
MCINERLSEFEERLNSGVRPVKKVKPSEQMQRELTEDEWWDHVIERSRITFAVGMSIVFSIYALGIWFMLAVLFGRCE